MCDLPCITEDTQSFESFPDESLLLINTSNPWYGDLILYLQTQHFHPDATRDERYRIHHHTKHYLIINKKLCHHGIDAIF